MKTNQICLDTGHTLCFDLWVLYLGNCRYLYFLLNKVLLTNFLRFSLYFFLKLFVLDRKLANSSFVLKFVIVMIFAEIIENLFTSVLSKVPEMDSFEKCTENFKLSVGPGGSINRKNMYRFGFRVLKYI